MIRAIREKRAIRGSKVMLARVVLKGIRVMKVRMALLAQCRNLNLKMAIKSFVVGIR